MSLHRFKGYFLVIVSSLAILAALVLMVMNLTNRCDFSLFGPIISNFRIGALMLLSALAGIVLYWLGRLLIRGIGMLRMYPPTPSAQEPTPPTAE